jgi:hypothetical protein
VRTKIIVMTGRAQRLYIVPKGFVMPDIFPDFSRAVFVKTAAGQQEIQSRALGLTPLQRRLLVLIDGKRNGQELAAFVLGHEVSELLQPLIEKACIEPVAPLAAPTPANVNERSHAAVHPAPAGQTDELASLPAPESRSAEEIDKARSFMVNTVNYIFGQNTRMVMLDAIYECHSAQDLRRVYPEWVKLMSSSHDGTKRLPELRPQLLKVL